MQVAAHAGLVGDDRSVLRISLPVAAVARRGVVNGAARDVKQLLVVFDEYGDQQRRTAGVEIGGPEDAATVS